MGPVDSALAPSPLHGSRGRVSGLPGGKREQGRKCSMAGQGLVWVGQAGQPTLFRGPLLKLASRFSSVLALAFGLDSPWRCVLHRAQRTVRLAGEGSGGPSLPGQALELFLVGSCPPLGRPARLHGGQGCWSPPLSFPPLATAASLSLVYCPLYRQLCHPWR